MGIVGGKTKTEVCSGQITVFLSLILVLVLSLVLTVAEAARIQAVKIHIENVASMGLESVFAEYDRDLLEEYELFFVDGAYGGEYFAKKNIASHLSSYMEYNYMPCKGSILANSMDLLKAVPEKVWVSGVMRATDYGGMVFRNQAADYMKNKTGIEVMERVFSMIQIKNGSEKSAEAYSENSRENPEKRKELEEEAAMQEETAAQEETEVRTSDKENDKEEDPSASVEKLKKLSILNLVMKKPEDVSKKKIALTNLPSRRQLPKEEMPLGENPETSWKLTEILFNEYIMEKFTTEADPALKGALDYEIEYILFGKESDIKNLQETAKMLLLMREGVNFLYLTGDKIKSKEAYLLALAVVGITGFLPLVKAVQMSILLAWAYGESVIDVRCLMSGGRLPFIKTEKDWHLKLDNLSQLQKNLDRDIDENSSNPDYEDYLRILLYAEKKDKKPLRCLDIIEEEMQKKKGTENFKVENCIAGAEVSMSWKADSLFLSFPFLKEKQYLSGGYYFTIEKRYVY